MPRDVIDEHRKRVNACLSELMATVSDDREEFLRKLSLDLTSRTDEFLSQTRSFVTRETAAYLAKNLEATTRNITEVFAAEQDFERAFDARIAHFHGVVEPPRREETKVVEASGPADVVVLALSKIDPHEHDEGEDRESRAAQG